MKSYRLPTVHWPRFGADLAPLVSSELNDGRLEVNKEILSIREIVLVDIDETLFHLSVWYYGKRMA